MKQTLFILLFPLLGTLYGKAQKDDHNFEVAKQLEIFCDIYRDLDMMYVDSLDAKEVVETGIRAMLRSLDPYTEYYPQADVKDLKQMITGKYGGIGSVVSYNLKEDMTVINEPYFGMPAQEAGLKKGDIILSIDGEDMKGKSTSYVSEHLRGEAGTSFILKVQRPAAGNAGGTPAGKTKKTKKDAMEGKGQVLSFKITRRAIQMPALPYYGMLTDSVGYINLSQFTEDCSKDVRHAVIDLKRKGMQSLVFDLRGNGGGSLSEAVNILNLFLPEDLSIVKTKGKLARANREYKTTALPIDTLMPLVVLVNGGTASSSEIMAGTLQDLDRGVVLGTKTFGKGLVQIPLDVPYNGNLKLTTAHYYIPSGRCIQAINYKHSNGGSREAVADSLKREFKTLHGRTVRDGGGIMPDVEVKPDSLPNIVMYLTTSGLDSTNVMMDYVVDYVAKHPQIAPAREFQISDADYDDFCRRAVEAGFKYDRESVRFLKDLEKVARFEGYYDRAKDEFEALEAKLRHDLAAELDYHRDMIKKAITFDIVTCYYYQAGAIESSFRYDKQVKEALDILGAPERYSALLAPQSGKETEN
ncbi:MAG: S41 family peptidase [Bacteroidales bacterium]|nr:S41 family peptidase [Bacteroidales bacterium]MCM1146801.1 S41 family peptidase [Bacteroidales bacterium]MCM1205701.1 S41 family peptidase [Bacillota bacterium]MCM1510769.1 S41 family peptidase [Clostridium sp.]